MNKSNPSKSKATTLKAIADELGVSIMTVSRALHNHPDLSDETKSRIVSKAIELGYKKIPSLNAKPAIKRVGLFLYANPNTTAGPTAFNSGVQKLLFFAIEEKCQQYKIEVVLQFPKTGEAPLSITNRTIDAAFLMGRYTAEDTAFFKGIPTLAISSFTPGAEIPCIIADNVGGIRQVTQYLIKEGHKDILFVSDDEGQFTEIFRARAEGYILAMIQNGLKPQTLFFKSETELQAALPEIRKATALVACSDGTAWTLSEILKKAGLSIPRDMSITGFDNLEAGFEFTTYAPNWNQLGQMAMDFIIHSSDFLGSYFKVIIPGNLIIRESTCKPRGC